MASIRILIPALLAAVSLPFGAAKSPEEFVGPAPADSARPARPAQAKPAPAAKPAAPASAAAAPAEPAPAGKPAAGTPANKAAAASPAKAGAPADSSRRRPAPAPAALDTARIHSLYLDGDFDQAVRALEGALKGKKARTHADSVFIFKHLGVMYAATPATRDKGRYYMLQLISIEPTAKILDMYASDMIYLIFRNVQEEYENKRPKAAAAPLPDTAPAARPPEVAKDTAAPRPPAASRAKRDRTLYWVAGGTAIAAGAVALLFVLFDDPQPKRNEIVLNE